MNAIARLRQAYDGMPHRRRQFLNLGLIGLAGTGALSFVFSLGQSQPVGTHANRPSTAAPTNLGVQVPGEIDPREAWLGTAGREVAQLKADVETQQRKEVERRATEATLMKRLNDLEQRADAPQPAAGQPPAAGTPPAAAPTTPTVNPAGYPPAAALPGGTTVPPTVSPAGDTQAGIVGDMRPAIVRISLGAPNAKNEQQKPSSVAPPGGAGTQLDEIPSTFLPVSFTHGLLLGGIDAPTGGQAQSNPLPILVRLTDNAILPNRYRAEVKDCFVVAAGYGDISSERVYARTVTLSCVRHNGSTLEMPIQGNLYGEDGKLGLRGRLVTKQGQLLANALRAGIASGIGQAFAQGGTTYTSSPFGTLATNSGGTGEQMRRGVAGGVGRALDNLANYYIRLAEQTFPVIEVDAARAVDVAITKGSVMPATAGLVDTPDEEGGGHERE